ncbi:MAG: helix-turn-helix transcriptional regulator [Alphaproteobacteria bacterium]|nr:helix-turn-helix transcriptional regulator [Alphaproteobacteria bacterium]
MAHDLLHIQGKPFMLVPLHDYRAMNSGGNVAESDLPSEILDSLHAGAENPIKLVRKFRGLTQEDLAAASGLSRPYLAEIETGRKDGSINALKALAAALNVPPGLLL